MTTVTATEVQNNFGKYLQAVQSGEEVVILRNGKEVARLISYEKSISFLTDSLIGVLEKDYNDKDMSAERMKRYAGID
ncbi:MAG: type II toxin-antitoxin system prevent-host-death family antitoxin [Bacillota bacterium]|nr:type II toxin-antitoxin system prevent-host-death family antitoxin [Bacillota bacterium]